MDIVERGLAILVIFVAGWTLCGFFQQRVRARVWLRPTRSIVFIVIAVACLAAGDLIGFPSVLTVALQVVLFLACLVGLVSFGHGRASTRARLLKEHLEQPARGR